MEQKPEKVGRATNYKSSGDQTKTIVLPEPFGAQNEMRRNYRHDQFSKNRPEEPNFLKPTLSSRAKQQPQKVDASKFKSSNKALDKKIPIDTELLNDQLEYDDEEFVGLSDMLREPLELTYNGVSPSHNPNFFPEEVGESDEDQETDDAQTVLTRDEDNYDIEEDSLGDEEITDDKNFSSDYPTSVLATIATKPNFPDTSIQPDINSLSLSTANPKSLTGLDEPIDFSPLLVTAKEIFSDLAQILSLVETKIRSFWFGPTPSTPISSFITNQLTKFGVIPDNFEKMDMSGDVLSITTQILKRYKIFDTKSAIKASLMFSAIGGGGYLASTMFGNLIFCIFKMVGLVVVEPPVPPTNLTFLGGIAQSLALGVSAAATLVQAFFTLAINFLGVLNTPNIIIAVLFAAVGYYFYKYKKDNAQQIAISTYSPQKSTRPVRSTKRVATKIQTKSKRSKY